MQLVTTHPLQVDTEGSRCLPSQIMKVLIIKQRNRERLTQVVVDIVVPVLPRFILQLLAIWFHEHHATPCIHHPSLLDEARLVLWIVNLVEAINHLTSLLVVI